MLRDLCMRLLHTVMPSINLDYLCTGSTNCQICKCVEKLNKSSGVHKLKGMQIHRQCMHETKPRRDFCSKLSCHSNTWSIWLKATVRVTNEHRWFACIKILCSYVKKMWGQMEGESQELEGDTGWHWIETINMWWNRNKHKLKDFKEAQMLQWVKISDISRLHPKSPDMAVVELEILRRMRKKSSFPLEKKFRKNDLRNTWGTGHKKLPIPEGVTNVWWWMLPHLSERRNWRGDLNDCFCLSFCTWHVIYRLMPHNEDVPVSN